MQALSLHCVTTASSAMHAASSAQALTQSTTCARVRRRVSYTIYVVSKCVLYTLGTCICSVEKCIIHPTQCRKVSYTAYVVSISDLSIHFTLRTPSRSLRPARESGVAEGHGTAEAGCFPIRKCSRDRERVLAAYACHPLASPNDVLCSVRRRLQPFQTTAAGCF